MRPRRDRHVCALAEHGGDLLDFLEPIGKVDVGEDAVVAATGEETEADGVSLAAIGRIAEDAGLGMAVGQAIEAFRGAVAAAVADEDDLLAMGGRVGEIAQHIPGPLDLGPRIVSGEDEADEGRCRAGFSGRYDHGTSAYST
jgi:hypothetical protein